jgi:hypothetical protein
MVSDMVDVRCSITLRIPHSVQSNRHCGNQQIVRA